ncbi:MAG: tetratricopeptide repeat protein, partial [Bacteroidia bacterium]
GDYEAALQYYLKSLPIKEALGEMDGVSDCYGNIGLIFYNRGDYTKAMAYFLKGIAISRQVGSLGTLANDYLGLGGLYLKQKNYPMAILYSDSAIKLSEKIGDLETARYGYQDIAVAYSSTGKYKEAYENHVRCKALTDSIFSIENSRQIGDLKTRFEVEKKESELKLEAKAVEIKNTEEKKRQALVTYAVAGMLFIVVVFSIFLFRRFKLTQRQKAIIEEQKAIVEKQKHLVEEHQKDLLDSIIYARRIQRALITNEKYIERILTKLNT